MNARRQLSPRTAYAFERLGLAQTADGKAIRRAWRHLVRRHHPDTLRANRAEANRRLAEINAAYDLVLAHASRMAQASAEQGATRPEQTTQAARNGTAGAARPAPTAEPRPAPRTRHTLAEIRFRGALAAMGPRPRQRLLGYV